MSVMSRESAMATLQRETGDEIVIHTTRNEWEYT